MTRPYVYRLTDNLTGLWYLGSSYRNGCHPDKLGNVYFSSSKLVKSIYKENPSRFNKEILLIGSKAYVIEIETRLLMLLDAKNDPCSYNMHNNDCYGDLSALNRSKVAKLANISNRLNKTAIYADGYYISSNFLKGAKAGGLAASKYNMSKNAGIFKPGYFSSDDFKRICSETSKRNAINKVGLMGRSKEKMKEDAIKASKVEWKCNICCKIMNSGNIVRHQKSSGHIGKERLITGELK